MSAKGGILIEVFTLHLEPEYDHLRRLRLRGNSYCEAPADVRFSSGPGAKIPEHRPKTSGIYTAIRPPTHQYVNILLHMEKLRSLVINVPP